MGNAAEQLSLETYEHELINPLGGRQLTEMESYVASLLLGATSAQPITIKEIIRRVIVVMEENLSEREVKMIVRRLRKDHALPILARRSRPYGYWWCKSAEEMAAFIETFKGQALDELTTVARMVRHNYPELAGQLRLEPDF